MPFYTPANDPRVKRGTSGFALLKENLQGLGNWVGDTFFGGSSQTNTTNENIAKENIEYQKEANEQNIAFTKAENEITRMREDNAVQRAAADMTAAGLSKTLAAGSPASAQSLSAPSVEPLNNSYQMQKNMAGLNMIDAVQNIVYKEKEAKRQQSIADAQIANINADTVGKNISNQTLADRLVNENALTIAKTAQTEALTNLYKTQNYFEQLLGPKKADELDSVINLNLAKYDESLASARYSDAMTNKAVQDTIKSVKETEYYKNLSDEVKHKVDYLVEQISYEKLKVSSLDWDLDFAKQWGYPTGQYPTSLFGVLERMGKGAQVASQNKAAFVKDKFTDFMHGYKDAYEGLMEFYDDEGEAIRGGGLFDALRGLFNFNVLNWLFK